MPRAGWALGPLPGTLQRPSRRFEKVDGGGARFVLSAAAAKPPRPCPHPSGPLSPRRLSRTQTRRHMGGVQRSQMASRSPGARPYQRAGACLRLPLPTKLGAPGRGGPGRPGCPVSVGFMRCHTPDGRASPHRHARADATLPLPETAAGPSSPSPTRGRAWLVSGRPCLALPGRFSGRLGLALPAWPGPSLALGKGRGARDKSTGPPGRGRGTGRPGTSMAHSLLDLCIWPA